MHLNGEKCLNVICREKLAGNGQMDFKIDDSEKNLDPRDLSAPTPWQYTCILQRYSKSFFSETAWPIKAKLYEEHC